MSSRDFDVLIATDFRHIGGTTASIAQEIEVQARLGLKTGLVQVTAPYLPSRPWAAGIRSLVGAGLCEVVSARRAVTARLLVLRHPRVFAAEGWSLAARADRAVMIANHVVADRAYPLPYYDVPAVMARLAAELGSAPVWAPIGPTVRDSLAGLPGGPELTRFDWHNVIDVDAWARPRVLRDGPPALGRHARDDIKKWPERPDDLLGAYPDSDAVRVRMLGGVRGAVKILGEQPARWEVLPFGSVPPEDFLASLDAYVYFHHSGMREAFGRAVLEALAAGLPVVTHPYLERLFGDVCVYAEARDAGRIAGDLVRERPTRNRRGMELVRERYDWEAHRRRLDDLLASKLPAVARAPAQRTRVLFVTSNGGGMGHLTRALAIARRLPADHEPLFLTMSTGIDAVRKEGFWVDYLPSLSDRDLGREELLDYVRARIAMAVRTLRPRALVFDGTFAYSPLVLALSEFPELFKVWSRRGMWKPVPPFREAQSMAQLVPFDLVIEPGELAGELDRGATVSQRGAVQVIDPIVYLDPAELLPRDQARRELGIPEGALSGLVNLGAGNINRLDNVLAAVADMLGRHPEVHVVGVQSLISRRGIPIDPGRIHPLATYPLSRVLRAFDFAIAAPGYNSFHELLAHAVPTLFIPNEETALDDQAARAEWGRARGMSLSARESEVDPLAAAIEDLLRPEVRASLAAACRTLPPVDGARMAAGLIAAGRPASAAAAPEERPAAVRAAPNGASVAAPPARSPIHPMEILRATRRQVKKTRNALRPHAEIAVRALRMRVAEVLPWSWVPPPPLPPPVVVPPPRALLVADRELSGGGSVEELIDWAAAHRGGAVILAGPWALQPLRRAGLAVELITELGREEIGDRIDFSAYWDQKARLLLETYNCGPVIFWGDSELRRHWPVLLLLDR